MNSNLMVNNSIRSVILEINMTDRFVLLWPEILGWLREVFSLERQDGALSTFHSHKPNWDIKTDKKELVFQQTLDSPSQHQNYKNRGKSFPTFLFLSLRKVKSSRPEVFLRTGVLKICSKAPMPKCDFNKVAKRLNWNRTSAWVFSCKFSTYFQNTFS